MTDIVRQDPDTGHLVFVGTRRPVQWWRNGDHPADAVGELADDPIGGGQYRRVEGVVVRFYRHPWTPGDGIHSNPDDHPCGRTWHDHGWIDQGPDGITVCPGDYVVTNPDGTYAVERAPLSGDQRLIAEAVALLRRNDRDYKVPKEVMDWVERAAGVLPGYPAPEAEAAPQ